MGYNTIWCIFRGSSCETDQGVFAAIFLASCKDLFSIICIFFHWERDPKKTEVSSVWLNYLSSPKGNLWRETRFSSSLPSDENWYRSHWCLEGWQMIRSHQRCRDEIVWRSHSLSGDQPVSHITIGIHFRILFTLFSLSGD